MSGFCRSVGFILIRKLQLFPVNVSFYTDLLTTHKAPKEFESHPLASKLFLTGVSLVMSEQYGRPVKSYGHCTGMSMLRLLVCVLIVPDTSLVPARLEFGFCNLSVLVTLFLHLRIDWSIMRCTVLTAWTKREAITYFAPLLPLVEST